MLSFSSLAVPRYTATRSVSSSLVRGSLSACPCSASRSPPHCCLPVVCLSDHFVLGFLSDLLPFSFRALSSALSLPIISLILGVPPCVGFLFARCAVSPSLCQFPFALLRSLPRRLLPQPPPSFCLIHCLRSCYPSCPALGVCSCFLPLRLFSFGLPHYSHPWIVLQLLLSLPAIIRFCFPLQRRFFTASLPKQSPLVSISFPQCLLVLLWWSSAFFRPLPLRPCSVFFIPFSLSRSSPGLTASIGLFS